MWLYVFAVESDSPVPEELHDRSQLNTLGEQERGRGVPQVVKAGLKAYSLVLGDELHVAGVVVFVNFAHRFRARLLVRAIAVGLVLRKSASADIDGELDSCRDFVGALLLMPD
jgi:hypothetical protein